MQVMNFFYTLAGLAYDLLYPLALIAQMPMGDITPITYTNPYSGLAREYTLKGLQFVSDILDYIGVGEYTVIQGIIAIFVFSILLIIVGKIFSWLIVGGDT